MASITDAWLAFRLQTHQTHQVGGDLSEGS